MLVASPSVSCSESGFFHLHKAVVARPPCCVHARLCLLVTESSGPAHNYNLFTRPLVVGLGVASGFWCMCIGLL